MLRNTTNNRLTKGVIAGVMAFSAVGLSACGNGTSGPEAGASVAGIEKQAGPYNGLYDTGFYNDIHSYAGEKVTVSADVNKIISPTSFTIAGTNDTTVPALLIVSANDTTNLAPGSPVQVTGTVQKAFDLPTVQKDLGITLDPALFDAYNAEPYIVASTIDTTVPTNSNGG